MIVLTVAAVLAAPFLLAQTNLVSNSGFDTDLSLWTLDPAGSTDSTWDDLDANGSPSSGSLLMNYCSLPGSICGFVVQPPLNERRQCVDLATVHEGYLVGGMVYIHSGVSGNTDFAIGARFRSGVACTGGTPYAGWVHTTTDQRATRDAWFSLDWSTDPLSPPANIQSVEFFVRLQESIPGGAAVQFDDVYLKPVGNVQMEPRVTIDGPDSVRVGELATYTVTAEYCDGPVETGWMWSVLDGVFQGSTSGRSVSVTWPTPGVRTISAFHPSCGETADSQIVNVLRDPARVVVQSFPEPLVQEAGVGGDTATYVLANTGDESTSVSLGQTGSFFTQSPSSFTLAPGATQTVTLTGLSQPAGSYSGTSVPTGTGVVAGSTVPVKLLVSEPAGEDVAAIPTKNRVDVIAPGTSSPSGTVVFRNTGSTSLSGVLTSSVRWIVPEPGIITIAPHSERVVTFTIDRSLRPDGDAPNGSVVGDLLLSFSRLSSAKTGAPGASPAAGVTTTIVSPVTIVDTAPPSASGSSIPALGTGEVALFTPGVGHVTGSVGVFISDLSLASLTRAATVPDVKLYYSAQLGASLPPQVASAGSVQPQAPLAYGDLVKSVFGNTSLGMLQIRSSRIEDIGVSANVFNSSNPTGTYGTAIPTFRSDRGAGPNESVYLVGLRNDASSHTNLYIGEVSGADVTVHTEFFSPAGASMGSRTDPIPAFGMTQLGFIVPEGAVSAVLTNMGSTGRFIAYATPVDEASGDFWAVSDWSAQYGYSRSAPVVIPIAGAQKGANQTYFRTDFAVMSTGAQTLNGMLRYVDRNGAAFEKSLSIPTMQTRVIEDVTRTFFGITTGTSGYVTFAPTTGEAVVTSRNYTTAGATTATFGSGVPTLSVASSLGLGDLRRMAGIEDSASATILAARPATFRTNFGLVETSGNAATVRVTVRFELPGSLATARVSAHREFSLAPNQFLFIGGLVTSIVGQDRDATLGDLRNVEADFEVIDGEGKIQVFLTSVDNGTGDSLLRTD